MDFWERIFQTLRETKAEKEEERLRFATVRSLPNLKRDSSANYLIAILEQSTLKSFLVLIRLKLSTFLCESVRFESVHNELAEGEGNDFMKLFISGKRENAERVTEATAACNTIAMNILATQQ